ncbi:MAG: pyruvate kinase [Flammeovirgaceae bacterium]|nr:pyruvate kinase [Flammeovirgaceae bacterium]
MKTTSLYSLKVTKESFHFQLATIVEEMEEVEGQFARQVSQLHDNFKLSGSNLIHYLVLRSKEIREAQEYLHHIGLSSLTNSESHTLSQVLNVLGWLNHTHGTVKAPVCDFETTSKLRLIHEQLLGVFRYKIVHIMVTFSSELMRDRMIVERCSMKECRWHELTAHDNQEVWLKMIEVLKKAIAKTGKNCKVYMDLGGPKIRIRLIEARKKKECLELPVSEGKELILCPIPGAETEETKKRRDRDILYIEPKEIITMVKRGEHIYFDDGKFEAKVIEKENDYVVVKIIRISTKKPLLKPQKGINLPDSDLLIPALTEEDKSNISFICLHADMVGYSFVSSPEDIELLRDEITKYAIHHRPAIILKIERLSAVQNLPALIMNGMKDEVLGVMIARGDLAVEIGFERLSEIQEEILWICEAAHVPVIWATQVLETLNKTGYTTRSEITDAAMGVRSECVMLNKGRYIVKTIKTLGDILTRQLGHINKSDISCARLELQRHLFKTNRIKSAR